jgi:hypothetical protein
MYIGQEGEVGFPDGQQLMPIIARQAFTLALAGIPADCQHGESSTIKGLSLTSGDANRMLHAADFRYKKFGWARGRSIASHPRLRHLVPDSIHFP